MIRQPNKPLTKNDRIVKIYLLLIGLTFLMNSLVAIENSHKAFLIILVVILVLDLSVFLSVWLSKSSYIQPSKQISLA